MQPEGWPGTGLCWLLAREWWGQGLAAEACRAAPAQREASGIGTLISLIRPDNRRSAALAQRLGATLAHSVDCLGAPAQVWGHRPACAWMAYAGALAEEPHHATA